jgi:hypothetical protein
LIAVRTQPHSPRPDAPLAARWGSGRLAASGSLAGSRPGTYARPASPPSSPPGSTLHRLEPAPAPPGFPDGGPCGVSHVLSPQARGGSCYVKSAAAGGRPGAPHAPGPRWELHPRAHRGSCCRWDARPSRGHGTLGVSNGRTP